MVSTQPRPVPPVNREVTYSFILHRHFGGASRTERPNRWIRSKLAANNRRGKVPPHRVRDRIRGVVRRPAVQCSGLVWCVRGAGRRFTSRNARSRQPTLLCSLETGVWPARKEPPKLSRTHEHHPAVDSRGEFGYGGSAVSARDLWGPATPSAAGRYTRNVVPSSG